MDFVTFASLSTRSEIMKTVIEMDLHRTFLKSRRSKWREGDLKRMEREGRLEKRDREKFSRWINVLILD